MIRQMTPQDVRAKLDSGEPVLLLDVRQPEEFEYCHIDGSTLVPLGELPRRMDEIDPPAGATVVVVCHHGVRSLSGAMIVARAGHADVVSMAGGIDAWSLAVDPTVPRY